MMQGQNHIKIGTVSIVKCSAALCVAKRREQN